MIYFYPFCICQLYTLKATILVVPHTKVVDDIAIFRGKEVILWT